MLKDTFEIIGMYHVILGACTTYSSWPPHRTECDCDDIH